MLGEPATNKSAAMLFVQWAGLVAGPLIAVLVYLLLGRAVGSVSGGDGAAEAAAGAARAVLSEEGRRTLAIAAWMAVWWISEAIPVSATALLPLFLLPTLGVASMKAAAAPYGDELIFLFLGGFLLGLAMEKCGLHKRIALITLRIVGTRPSMMVGGVMLATALISMWVSNTATTIMMLPIATSVVAMTERLSKAGAAEGRGWSAQDVDRLAVSLLLGIAYAASIGGIGTPIGTPPNLILMRNAEVLLGRHIDFIDWMKIGVPLVALVLPMSWLLLTRVLYPVRSPRIEGGREMVKGELRSLGRMSANEWLVFGVFVLAVVWWLLREPLCARLGLMRTEAGKGVPRLADSTIAIGAALLLFVIPVNARERRFALTWEDAEKLPWGVLILFGGGLSLAAAIGATGCDKYLGGLFTSMAGLPLVVVLAALVFAVIALGELASNTAMTAAMMPVVAAVGPAMGVDPMLLMVTAAVAASCGFMLPVATPPNAIVFATGRIGMGRMVKSGAALDVVCGVVVVVFMWLAGPWLLGMVVK